MTAGPAIDLYWGINPDVDSSEASSGSDYCASPGNMRLCFSDIGGVLFDVGWPCRVFRVSASEYTEFRYSNRNSDSFVRFTYVDAFPIIRDEEKMMDEVLLGIYSVGKFAFVDELDSWQAFGPNGKQVEFLLHWYRELNATYHADSGTLAKTHPFEDIWNAYKRVATLRWPMPGVAFQATPSLRGLFRCRDLVKAWHDAPYCADISERRRAGSYLTPACPDFVAVLLRDVLPPAHFAALYAPLSEFVPLATLDGAVPPVGF